MAQGHLKWDQNELIDEKTGCKKSCESIFELLFYLLTTYSKNINFIFYENILFNENSVKSNSSIAIY